MRTISAVVPAHDAARFLERSLPPLVDAVRRGALGELIVVDDGSTDATAAVARAAGATVVHGGTRRGPAAARNLGVGAARGDVVLFVDADVQVHADVPERVLAAFEASPGCAAVFGRYDERPVERGFVSLYKNLLHAYVHETGRERASTFWAGCGAVDRAAFLAASGFDAVLYPEPSIEDIDLGARLSAAGGRIVLAKDVRATHLKRWTLASLVATDVMRRAVPWSRLMLRSGRLLDDLNVARRERAKAALSLALWASIAAAPWLPAAPWAAGALAAAAWCVNRGFFAFVRRHAGAAAAVAAFGLHQLYYLYASAAFAWCWAEHRLRPPSAGGASPSPR